MLRSPNVPPALFTNFGALRLGAVIVPTSPMLSPNEIAHIANNAEAKVIVVAAAFLEGVIKARPNLKTVKHVIVFGGQPEELKAQGLLSYEELVANESPALDSGPPSAHGGLRPSLHVGHDGHAQGNGPLHGRGPDRPGHLRQVRMERPTRRHHLRPGSHLAGCRVLDRGDDPLPVRRRGFSDPQVHSRGTLRADPEPQGDDPERSAHGVPEDARGRRARRRNTTCRVCAS